MKVGLRPTHHTIRPSGEVIQRKGTSPTSELERGAQANERLACPSPTKSEGLASEQLASLSEHGQSANQRT